MNNIVYTAEGTLYGYYEKQSRSVYSRRTIDGKTVGCSKCVGYCSYDEHTGFLTQKLRKQHNCIKKRCDYYIGKKK